MAGQPSVIDVHTPSSSFSIVHSVTEDSLQQLFDQLSRKAHTDYHGTRVGPGWLKYHWNDSVWNLDDTSDYTIFVWRQKSAPAGQSPTLHLHNPETPLPAPPAYMNPSYYLFQPSRAISPPVTGGSAAGGARSVRSGKSKRTKGSKHAPDADSLAMDGIPKHKKEFEKFHSENGVRTVMGSIGPVENVRMLLKNGYRNVYISRKFAMQHAFIPHDAAPGHYGYSGLVNIGTWPITLTPASSLAEHPDAPATAHKKKSKPKAVSVPVYLSEEPHFDVVLGRSFFEKRQMRTSTVDPTEVVCMDTGEKIECELVILKDGRGEIVTVT